MPGLQRLADTYRQAVAQGQADVLSYYTAWNDLTPKRLDRCGWSSSLPNADGAGDGGRRLPPQAPSPSRRPRQPAIAGPRNCRGPMTAAIRTHARSRPARRGRRRSSAATAYSHVASAERAAAAPVEPEPGPRGQGAGGPAVQEETIDETLAALGTVEAAAGETQTLQRALRVPRGGSVLVVGGQSSTPARRSSRWSRARTAAWSSTRPGPGATTPPEPARPGPAALRDEAGHPPGAAAGASRRAAGSCTSEPGGARHRRQAHAAGRRGGHRQPRRRAAGPDRPAGGPLLETIGEDQIVVRLGVRERGRRPPAGRARRCASSRSTPQARAFGGQVRWIAREVNPETRLVSVFVAPAAARGCCSTSTSAGGSSIASSTGLVVPRQAVLPEEGTYVLYTVEDGHAVRHEVKVGLENAGQVELLGHGLQAGPARRRGRQQRAGGRHGRGGGAGR